MPKSYVRREDKSDALSEFRESLEVYSNAKLETKCLRSSALVAWHQNESDYKELLEFDPAHILITVGHETFHLPIKLKKIADAIKDALRILDHEDDWDDAGAVSTDSITFRKAVKFLISYATYISKNGVIEAPFIDLLRDGSVTVMWETDKASLLIVFKKGNKDMSYVFGYDKLKNREFKYSIEKEEAIDEILAAWMSKYLV